MQQTKPSWLIIGLISLCLLSVIRYERFAGKRHFGDFHVYYVTGQRLLAGQTVYMDDLDQVTPFKYSPLVAAGFAVLALTSEPWAAGIWHILNLFFLIGSIYLCFLMLEKIEFYIPRTQWIWLGSLGVLGVSPPLIHCLNSGQVGLAILFFLVTGVYLALVNGKIQSGSFFLALATMFKFLPLLITPYLILRKQFKLCFYYFLWLLIFHLLPFLWLGWDRFVSDLSGFLPFLTSTTLDHISLLDYKNQSIWSYLYRLLYYDLGFFQIQTHPEWLIAFGLACFVMFYALVYFSSPSVSLKAMLIDFALLSIMMLIFNPNAWKHNFVLLIYPYFMLMGAAHQKHWRTYLTALLIFISVLLLGSNRSGLGWYARYDLMSLSILFIAAYTAFAGLVLAKITPKGHIPPVKNHLTS